VGGLIVALDQLEHFNRYGAANAQPAWALRLPWRIEYLTFCTAHESDCVRAKMSSKFW
jgi:hypothetical protein